MPSYANGVKHQCPEVRTTRAHPSETLVTFRRRPVGFGGEHQTSSAKIRPAPHRRSFQIIPIKLVKSRKNDEPFRIDVRHICTGDEGHRQQVVSVRDQLLFMTVPRIMMFSRQVSLSEQNGSKPFAFLANSASAQIALNPISAEFGGKPGNQFALGGEPSNLPRERHRP